MKKASIQEAVLILDNIRSAQNVGALFRTADAVGVSKVYLVGITPTPIDTFNRPRTDIAKTALGAEKTIPWEYKKLICPLIRKMKRDGYTTVAIEQSTKSVDYKKVKLPSKVAIILGNEVTGIEQKTLDLVDTVAEIPMRGSKESLNVSVAGGIALFRLLDR